MRKIVKLFFGLILVGTIAIIPPASSAFAEEVPQTPAPTETTTETTEAPKETELSGDEWDGIINDPVNTSVKEPATTEPTTIIVTEVTTTVTPPATRNYVSTPKTESAAETEIETEPELETPTENTTELTSEEPSTTDSIEAEDSSASEDVKVPETSTPGFVFDETTRKITLLSLTSTAIVYFLFLEIWSLKNLIKIKKNEKLLRSAKEKATEVKQAKITRSTN
ncbi:hypothetical protein IKF84_00280 [Candidatus Saccharibacteria bacterium]|nr:hypothetical protein [Candidatus Saccharibacteria bacterium]